MGAQNTLRALVLLLSFSAAGGSVFAQHSDTLSVFHYTHAVRLATEGRYEEARERFEKALEADSLHAPSMYELANMDLEGEDGANALKHASRALELDPSNKWYKRLKARALLAGGLTEPAVTLFEEMVAGEDFDPENNRLLAVLYYRHGRTEEALATLDSAEVRMGPTSEITEMKRGILIEAGRIEAAAAVTERYVAAAPYDEENRLALAEIYAYQRRDSLAAATLKEVVEINPDNVRALESLLEIYRTESQTALYFATLRQFFSLPEISRERKTERLEMLLGNTTLYRTHFFELGELVSSLATQYPGDAGLLTLYADHAIRAGDTEGALTLLKNFSKRQDSPSLDVFTKIVEFEAYLGRADSVTLWSDRALRAFPGEVEIYLHKAAVLQYLKRPGEARKTLDGALRVATTDSLRSEVHGALGTLWHEMGNNKKTFAEYEKALKTNADNALVLNNYAYFLALERRDLDRALNFANRAVALKENDATYLDTQAWVLYTMGNFVEARRVMQQALPLDRNQNPELLIHYGDILWALDERFMASVYWKRAREAGYQPVSEIEERLGRAK